MKGQRKQSRGKEKEGIVVEYFLPFLNVLILEVLGFQSGSMGKVWSPKVLIHSF